jgi:hypothetical protein
MPDIAYLIGGGVFIRVAASYTRFCSLVLASVFE